MPHSIVPKEDGFLFKEDIDSRVPMVPTVPVHLTAALLLQTCADEGLLERNLSGLKLEGIVGDPLPISRGRKPSIVYFLAIY